MSEREITVTQHIRKHLLEKIADPLAYDWWMSTDEGPTEFWASREKRLKGRASAGDYVKFLDWLSPLYDKGVRPNFKRKGD